MLRDTREAVGITRHMNGCDGLADDVSTAMREVSRHAFLDPDVKPHAYHDGPLPIGHGRTVSQPHIVALMNDLANLGHESPVLKAAAGAGYPAAMLWEMVTAAAPTVPHSRGDQLKPGGRLVIPVGQPGLGQELLLQRKTAGGEAETPDVLPVACFPLTEAH